MAFPTTSVIDQFNRGNESPIASPWSAVTVRESVSSALLEISSQVVGDTDSGGSVASQYYTSATYGPDCEVYCSVPTLPANYYSVYLFARITDSNPAYCYWVVTQAAPTNTMQFWKTMNDVHTQLGADVAFTMTAGDTVGLEIIGTTLKFYRKPSAGSWSEIANRTDEDISAVGYIGFGVIDAACRLDDFGGGTVVAAVTGSPGSIATTITL